MYKKDDPYIIDINEITMIGKDYPEEVEEVSSLDDIFSALFLSCVILFIDLSPFVISLDDIL